MRNRHLITLVLLLCLTKTFAQSPPARTWHYDKYKHKQGVKERWDEDANGLKHGKYISYFSGGERQTLGFYNHGQKDGLWVKTICQDAIFSIICATQTFHMVNGKVHGSFKTEIDGVITSIGQYSNDEQTGYWKEGYNNEIKEYREGLYKNGKRIGKWINTKFYPEDPYSIISTYGDVVKFEKGFTTHYDDNGQFIKCISSNGINIKEQDDYEKANTLEEYTDFLEKYPSSIYAKEIKKKLKEAQKEADNEKAKAILDKKIANGDLDALIKRESEYPDSVEVFMNGEMTYLQLNTSNKVLEFQKNYLSDWSSDFKFEVKENRSAIIRTILESRTDVAPILDLFKDITTIEIKNGILILNSFKVIKTNGYIFLESTNKLLMYTDKLEFKYSAYASQFEFTWKKYNEANDELKYFYSLLRINKYLYEHSCFDDVSVALLISMIYDIENEQIRKNLCVSLLQLTNAENAICTTTESTCYANDGSKRMIYSYTKDFKIAASNSLIYWVNNDLDKSILALQKTKDETSVSSYTTDGKFYRKFNRDVKGHILFIYKSYIKGTTTIAIPLEKDFLKRVKKS